MLAPRFMRSVVDVTTISVHITIADDRGYNVLNRISYRLAETGYPDPKTMDIYDLCPDLDRWLGGGKLDGRCAEEPTEPADVG